MSVKYFPTLVLMLFIVSVALLGQTKFDPTLDAVTDFNSAVKTAQLENKRIFVDVGGLWCSWCRAMDKFFVDNSDLEKYLNDNFVILKVNYSKENKNEDFLSPLPKIEGYPHIFIFEKDGKLLFSKNTGELENGKSYDKNKYLAFLKDWVVSE